MKPTFYLKCAAAAAMLVAPPAVIAKDDPSHGKAHSTEAGTRSYHALPQGAVVHRAGRGEREEIARNGAEPPYCRGNKYGLDNGEGSEHGRGKPFTCNRSPG